MSYYLFLSIAILVIALFIGVEWRKFLNAMTTWENTPEAEETVPAFLIHRKCDGYPILVPEDAYYTAMATGDYDCVGPLEGRFVEVGLDYEDERLKHPIITDPADAGKWRETPRLPLSDLEIEIFFGEVEE